MWRFERAAVPHGAVVRLTHIRLRPTRLCCSLWLLGAAVWVGAANYQVNAAYAVCFWLFAFSGAAALAACRQLSGLHLQMDWHGEVFAGETAAVALSCGGLGRRSRLFWWRGSNGGDWQRAVHHAAQPYAGVWSVAVERRGYFPSPLFIQAATTAPFGLFYAECRLAWQTEAVVYPAPVPHREHGGTPRPDELAKPQPTAAHGDDPAFLKAHQPGASLQHVAWKTYAKRGELMDKVFDEPPLSVRGEWIAYHDYPPATPADRLAGLLAYRVLAAERSGLPYTLVLPQQQIAPQNGQREKCLNALALL